MLQTLARRSQNARANCAWKFAGETLQIAALFLQGHSRVGAMAARNQPDQGHPAVVTRLGEGRAAGIPWVGAPLTLRLPYYARRTPAGRN